MLNLRAWQAIACTLWSGRGQLTHLLHKRWESLHEEGQSLLPTCVPCWQTPSTGMVPWRKFSCALACMSKACLLASNPPTPHHPTAHTGLCPSSVQLSVNGRLARHPRCDMFATEHKHQCRGIKSSLAPGQLKSSILFLNQVPRQWQIKKKMLRCSSTATTAAEWWKIRVGRDLWWHSEVSNKQPRLRIPQDNPCLRQVTLAMQRLLKQQYAGLTKLYLV